MHSLNFSVMAATNPDPVKILEVCRVTPSTDSLESANESSLPLTYFDIFWLKFYPVEHIFFYELTDTTPSFFNSFILPKLKSSLSLTLLHFLPLAGNIIWPPNSTKPFILYTPNDGIFVTIAESNADFARLSSNQMKEAIELHLYIPELLMSDSKTATIAFQITLFPNQGFSIGVSFNHAIFDGKSAIMFIKAWANICKLSKTEKNPTLLPELTPFFDRTIVQDPQGLDMIYLNNWLEAKLPGLNVSPRTLKGLQTMRSSISNLVQATFELSREDIKKFRKKVVSLLDDPNQIKSMHFSAFVLSYAYTIVCMVKARKIQKEREFIIGFSAECRARLDPPIPETYFGNCIIAYNIITKEKPLLKENGIAFIAKRLGDIIKGLQKGVHEGAKEKLANILKVMEAGEAEKIGVSFSPRFEVYGTDFGWGRPKKMDVISEGGISMVESRDESGGIEIGLAMKKHEMEIFHSLFVNGLLDP